MVWSSFSTSDILLVRIVDDPEQKTVTQRMLQNVMGCADRRMVCTPECYPVELWVWKSQNFASVILKPFFSFKYLSHPLFQSTEIMSEVVNAVPTFERISYWDGYRIVSSFFIFLSTKPMHDQQACSNVRVWERTIQTAISCFAQHKNKKWI